MKKLSVLFSLLFVVAFIACKDDENPTPTFQKSQFIGEWEVTAYAGTDGSSDGPCEYIITNTEFNEVSGCDSGFEISFGGEYTFDNKNKITLEDDTIGELSWIILEISGTTMKLEQRLDGTKYGTVTTTKK